MSNRADKLGDGRTDGLKDGLMDTGNNNTRRPKLASGKNDPPEPSNLSQKFLTSRGVCHLGRTVQSLYFLSWTTVLPHGLLVAKNHAYGLTMPACELLADYQSQRKQNVKIGGVRSSWTDLHNSDNGWNQRH